MCYLNLYQIFNELPVCPDQTTLLKVFFHLRNPRNNRLIGGAGEDRTPDPLRARQVLSQLSYNPIFLRRPLPLCGVIVTRALSRVLTYTPSFTPADPCLKKKSLQNSLSLLHSYEQSHFENPADLSAFNRLLLKTNCVGALIT